MYSNSACVNYCLVAQGLKELNGGTFFAACLMDPIVE